MSDWLRALEAQAHAEEVVRSESIRSLPVDPFAIAQARGIDVRPGLHNGASGCLLRVGERFGIMYSTAVQNEGWIRFTVSHELGHYFLPGHCDVVLPPGQVAHASKAGFVSKQWYERQADHFAASLLMPRALFSNASDGKPASLSTVQELADLCRTSLTATAIQYAKLADDGVAVVVSKGRRVEYCFMSEALKSTPGLRWIRKGAPVPRHTVTGRRTGDVGSGLAEGESFLDDWFDGAPSAQVWEEALELGSYGKTLTLIAVEDLAELDEDEDDWARPRP